MRLGGFPQIPWDPFPLLPLQHTCTLTHTQLYTRA